ncbi:hypothetical protein DVA86_32760 [Streptomyces armeniacus]|uniref:Erythromycin biosynthesis protein CIII-like C-terminal domain-containing protein n=1 Tax=Streptomyces armeniacus TaxID=83291 RepID=A0A345XYB7_9ACTN|nr:hypothetical protein DVA86_32760 [Streptomyces armeniacus]
MSHPAVLPLTDFGHAKPAVEVAAELVRRGHRVTQVVDERYAGLAAEAGARVVTYRSRRRRLGGHELSAADMGSMMQALAHRTPLVAVPQAPENRFNARRVTELGLGRTLPRGELMAHALRAVVDEVANDAGVRDNAVRMSGPVRAAGGADRAADVLEGWFGQRPN